MARCRLGAERNLRARAAFRQFWVLLVTRLSARLGTLCRSGPLALREGLSLHQPMDTPPYTSPVNDYILCRHQMDDVRHVLNHPFARCDATVGEEKNPLVRRIRTRAHEIHQRQRTHD